MEPVADECPVGCAGGLRALGRYAPYRVCPTCGTASRRSPSSVDSWSDDEPSAEQVAFWSGRHALWEATIGPGRGRLADVGCGFGHFVAWAVDQGWDAWGTEPSEFARARTAAPGRVAATMDELDGSFDRITLWDVLEHVVDPLEFARALRHRLTPSGELLVCSPDFLALRLRWRWLARDPRRFSDTVKPEEHLVQFSRRGLRILLQRAGYRSVRFLNPPVSRASGPLANLARVPGVRSGLFAVARSGD